MAFFAVDPITLMRMAMVVLVESNKASSSIKDITLLYSRVWLSVVINCFTTDYIILTIFATLYCTVHATVL